MDSISLLREQLRAAHEYLDETMADVSPEQLHWIPPGRATPLGANYLHLIQSEDMLINGAVQRKATLASGEWAGKIGATEPMPLPPSREEDYLAWTRRVKIDLPALRDYANAVYAASDAYLSTLSPDDLDKQVDLAAAGSGSVTLAWVLSRYIVGHADNICGEASALKGVQGARGYAE